MRKFSKGFTLIEMLVVLTVVSILVAVLSANFIQADRQKNDAQRKADLRNLQNAIELYKNKYGKYPAGCKGANAWSGHSGTFACSGGSNAYIVGLAPEFIPTLPIDPSLNGADSGYIYVANSDGSVYKLVAKNTVESEIVTDAHEFKSCDVIESFGATDAFAEGVLCNQDFAYSSGSTPPWCTTSYTTDNVFRTSYGVWGGYANAAGNTQRNNTQSIVCKKP